MFVLNVLRACFAGFARQTHGTTRVSGNGLGKLLLETTERYFVPEL